MVDFTDKELFIGHIPGFYVMALHERCFRRFTQPVADLPGIIIEPEIDTFIAEDHAL